MKMKLFALIALVPLVVIAHAQDNGFGPRIGLFLPTDSKVRDAFGSNFLNFGFGRARNGVRASTRTDFSVINADRNGNRLFLVPVTLVREYRLMGDMDSATQVYGRLGAGLAYMDYALTSNGTRIADKRLGVNGNAEIGLLLTKRINVFARYDLFNRQEGINFSGFTVGLSYTISRF
ncbi:MAG: outer membrane beta-barrel protein [Fimbriimonadaceae bacterium]|nr:outer membrane beta-barrel protein [Fimbriimonadaceae bacterium]